MRNRIFSWEEFLLGPNFKEDIAIVELGGPHTNQDATLWRFPKMGGIPKWMLYSGQSTCIKLNDLGVLPLKIIQSFTFAQISQIVSFHMIFMCRGTVSLQHVSKIIHKLWLGYLPASLTICGHKHKQTP